MKVRLGVLGVLGVLVVAVLVGAGAYKAFIDPNWSPNTGKSVSFTRACLDGDPDLEIDEAATEEINRLIEVAGVALAGPECPYTCADHRTFAAQRPPVNLQDRRPQ